MWQWIQSNLQWIIFILIVVVGPVVGRILRSLANYQQQEEVRRQRAAQARATEDGSTFRSEIERAEAEGPVTEGPSMRRAMVEARQREIEAWRQRGTGAGPVTSVEPGSLLEAEVGKGTVIIATPSGTFQLGIPGDVAARRHAALEEWRRRQGLPAGQAPPPTQSPSRVGAQRPQRSGQPRGADWTAAGTGQGRRSGSTSPSSASPGAPTSQGNRRSGGSLEPPRQSASARQGSDASEFTAPSSQSSTRAAAVPGLRATGTGSIIRLSPAGLRQAFILKELLDPPLALRD